MWIYNDDEQFNSDLIVALTSFFWTTSVLFSYFKGYGFGCNIFLSYKLSIQPFFN